MHPELQKSMLRSSSVALAHQFLDGTITAEGEATLTAMQTAQNFTGSMADFLSLIHI